MKFAIGLMACIAIAFTFVTSPQSQPHASMESSASQSVDRLTLAVQELQHSLQSQTADIEERMNAKFVAFTETLPKPTSPQAMPDSDELWTAVRELEDTQKKLTARVAQLEAAKKVAAAMPAVNYPSASSVTVASGGSTGGYTQSYSQSYSPRWHNNDGKSLRDHMIQDHGFDPSLSTEQMAMQHDAYHDQYGPSPPTRSVTRTRQLTYPQYQPAMRSRSVQVQSSGSSCPGGVCPTSRSVQVQSSGGLLGFGILGRRR